MVFTEKSLITASKMSIACAIAFLIYYHYQTPMGFWSIITIGAVAQSQSHNTAIKSIMRIIGTLVGAIIGYTVATIAHQNPTILLPAIFCLITLSSFFALQETIFSYAGIVAGMTIAIIVFFSVMDTNIYHIAIDRSIEILIGVVILFFINMVILLFKKDFLNALKDTWHTLKTHPFSISNTQIIPAIKVASACLFIFILWYYFHLPEGYWAAITCLIVMEEKIAITFEKGVFRFSSHFIAASLSLLIALFIPHNYFILRIIPLCAAFFLCGLLVGSKSRYQEMGNTIAVAVTIMLISNPNEVTTNHLIFWRFFNVLIGVSIAFITLAIGPIKKRI